MGVSKHTGCPASPGGDFSGIRREGHHTTSKCVLSSPNLYIFVATATVLKMIVGAGANKGECPKNYEIVYTSYGATTTLSNGSKI
jgi:hypothetical protein